MQTTNTREYETGTEMRALGWQRFDQLDWVAALLKRLPIVERFVYRSSFADLEKFNPLLAELLREVPKADRPWLRRYIHGKLLLEQISGAAHGAGAGSCDKMAAYNATLDALDALRD